MRALRKLQAILLLILSCCPLIAAGAPLPLAQYLSTLQQLRQSVLSARDSTAIASLAQQLPAQWQVVADGREFPVASYALRGALNDYRNQYTPANRDAVIAQLDLLLRDAQAMLAPKANFSAERSRLADILARREFHNAIGESWWDRVKRSVQSWLLRLLQRLVESTAYPAIGQFLVWALLVAALAVAAFWIVRTYRTSNIYTQFSGPEAVSNKPWRDWESEAQAAAREGRWRDAVHLLYWAGISFLESQGLWRPDRARTPREYLRLLPAGAAHRVPLQQLTRSFETVWYGRDEATAQTFASASALLEQMGCR
jgi:hypothetical protein